VEGELVRLGVAATVDAGVVDGSVQIDVSPQGDADLDVVRRALESFTVQWRLAVPT
jgi:hypothetical protein